MWRFGRVQQKVDLKASCSKIDTIVSCCSFLGLTCLAHRVQESSSHPMVVTEVMAATSEYKLLQRELAASAPSFDHCHAVHAHSPCFLHKLMRVRQDVGLTFYVAVCKE